MKNQKSLFFKKQFHFFFAIITLFLSLNCYSQKSNSKPFKIRYTPNGNIDLMYLAPTYFLNFDDFDNATISINDAFDGSIKYIENNFYPEIAGKIKNLGSLEVSYYTGDFYPEIKGKLKSISNLDISYYTGEFYPEIKGKIKSIGNTKIEYYTGDFYPEIKGKVKSIGGKTIEYYTGSFYPELKGKIKSVKGSI
jgi:hypothetical protein